jgi:AraC-like DNA-binding protein
MAFVRNVAMAAAARGAGLADICHALGLRPEALDQPGARAALPLCTRVWDEAVARTGDPFLGLHLGETTSPALGGMVGYLMESSPDLLTAFQSVTQYNRSFSNATEYAAVVRGDELHYFIEPAPQWQLLSPEAARQVVDHSLSAFVQLTRLLSGRTLYPLRVAVRHSRPRDVREYLRILKCEPAFGQDANFLVYRLRDMKLPTLGHNPALNRLFRELLEEEMAKAGPALTFAGEVRQTILRQFDTHLPQLQEVTATLHVSPRQLQRKLKEEGLTFQQITESVRLELALGMLRNRNLSINAIAYRLGYAEPSVFRRAFKKWTGSTPKEYAERRLFA